MGQKIVTLFLRINRFIFLSIALFFCIGMKQNTLSIDIRKPVSVVFAFTIDPNNTPKWIPSILKEQASDTPVKVGTLFSQVVSDSAGGTRSNLLVVTALIENKRLDFHQTNSAYTCSYRFEKIPAGTRLTYFEENGVNGKLESPLKPENLEKLKQLIEKGD